MTLRDLDFVYIRVEVFKREFLSRLELATQFLAQGVAVIIGEVVSDSEIRMLSEYRGYYYGKCAQHATALSVKILRDCGWRLGAFDEEGLLPYDLDSFAKRRFSGLSASLFSEIFFFGKAQLDVFSRRYSNPDLSMYCYGSPRIDEWHSKGYGVHDSSAQQIHERFGRYILFPLNFATYTNKRLRDRCREGAMGSEYIELSARSEFLFDKFCRLAGSLQADGLKVILRPHPADLDNDIINLSMRHGLSLPSCQVSSRYSVAPWILASSGLIHNCCTTAVEAALMGKPVMAYQPGCVSLYDDSFVNSIGLSSTVEAAAIAFASKDSSSDGRALGELGSWDRLNLEFLGSSSTSISGEILSRYCFNRDFCASPSSGAQAYIENMVAASIGFGHKAVYRKKFSSRTSAKNVSQIASMILAYKRLGLDLSVKKIGPKLFILTRG
jgi:surface carbohydrate biosynthesis protein